ncbi:MAG TPA: AraC family ligand binding domain-containing protein [Acidimicrobiales bacterium]
MTEPATGFVDEMSAAGHQVTEWSNSPGDTYAPHSHGYRKVLCCLEGSIVFHLPDGDVQLSRGERMDLRPGVVHSATVGPTGVQCAEAHL